MDRGLRWRMAVRRIHDIYVCARRLQPSLWRASSTKPSFILLAKQKGGLSRREIMKVKPRLSQNRKPGSRKSHLVQNLAQLFPASKDPGRGDSACRGSSLSPG